VEAEECVGGGASTTKWWRFVLGAGMWKDGALRGGFKSRGGELVGCEWAYWGREGKRRRGCGSGGDGNSLHGAIYFELQA